MGIAWWWPPGGRRSIMVMVTMATIMDAYTDDKPLPRTATKAVLWVPSVPKTAPSVCARSGYTGLGRGGPWEAMGFRCRHWPT